jgi:hypothetical protein
VIDAKMSYTRVHDSHVFGRIVIDPSISPDEIHIYRVSGDKVVMDKIFNIGSPLVDDQKGE